MFYKEMYKNGVNFLISTRLNSYISPVIFNVLVYIYHTLHTDFTYLREVLNCRSIDKIYSLTHTPIT